jgi:hypothetical protein
VMMVYMMVVGKTVEDGGSDDGVYDSGGEDCRGWCR